MPDDERRARRPGDDLPGDRPERVSGDASSDASEPVTVPDPARPRHATAAPEADGETLEDVAELDDFQDFVEPGSRSTAAAPRATTTRPPPLPPAPRPAKASVPPPGRRQPRAGAPLDLRGLPDADSTKENRGAVGVKHAHSGALTTNAASGTISDDQTPIFNRAAIAAGSRAARAGSISSAASDRSLISGAAGSSAVSGAASSVGASLDRPNLSASAILASTPIAVGDARTETAAAPYPRESVAPLTGALAIKATRIGRSSAAELDDTRIPPPTHRADARLPATAFASAGGDADPDAIAREARPPARAARATAEVLNDLRIASRGGPREPLPAPRGAIVIGGAVFNESSITGADPLALPVPASAPSAAREGAAVSPVGGSPTAASLTAASLDGAAVAAPTRPIGEPRTIAALPSRRGIDGDVRYLFTATAGVARARRELAQIADEHARRQQARRQQLTQLGQTAVTDGVAHPAVEPARDRLDRIADERAQHAERVEAGDVELARVQAERDTQAAQLAIDLTALDAELAALARQRAPLDREVATIRTRAAALRASRDELDAKIGPIKANLAGPKRAKLDVAATQARLAALMADRAALQRAEPALAGTIDALYPQLAALAAERARAERTRAERVAADLDQQGGATDVHAAIAARRKVLDRATAEADTLRDQILLDLGEQLALDRPAVLGEPLAAIDELDHATDLADRRALELHEILASVDRGKLARGAALLVLALAVVTACLLYVVR